MQGKRDIPDRQMLHRIQELTAEAHDLSTRERLGAAEHQRLESIHAELDQYRELLRERRRRPTCGRSPRGTDES